MEKAFEILSAVHRGELAFDRTVDVTPTYKREKQAIKGKMPPNLESIGRLIAEDKQHFMDLLGASSRYERKDAENKIRGLQTKSTIQIRGRRAHSFS